MATDVEYRAYQQIVKNDKRQRLAVYLLMLTILTAIIFSILYVVKSQKALVAAAQQDSRIRTEENRRYVTCLLVIPIANRDEAGQKYCFDKSDLPGGRKASEFTPINADSTGAAISSAPNTTQGQMVVLEQGNESSFTNSTPVAAHPQSESPQTSSEPSQTTQPVAPEPVPTPAPTNPTTPSQPSLLQRIIQPVLNVIGGL